MRSSTQRKKKYAAKTDGVLSHKQIAAHKKGFAGALAGQVQIEHTVKNILTTQGVFPGLNHFYMVFGKELKRLMLDYSGETLMTEVEGLQIKWGGRGLDTSVLDLIKESFGLTVPPGFCLFDVGRFDECLFG